MPAFAMGARTSMQTLSGQKDEGLQRQQDRKVIAFIRAELGKPTALVHVSGEWQSFLKGIRTALASQSRGPGELLQSC